MTRLLSIAAALTPLLVMGVGLCYLRFLLQLERRTRLLFVAAGALFVGGALGMEMIAGIVVESYGVASLGHTAVDGVSVPTFLEELHPLCLEAFGESPLFEPVSREVFRGLYQEVLTRPEADLTHWARNAEGRLVGFIFAFRQASEMVIKTVAVIPAARGSRLSRALVHFAVKAAAEAGIHTFISALVRRGNTSEYLGLPHLMPGVETWTQDYVLLRRSVAP